MSDPRRTCSLGMVMVLLTSLLSGRALAIVLHPGEYEPNLVEWTDRPHDDVVGRWGIILIAQLRTAAITAQSTCESPNSPPQTDPNIPHPDEMSALRMNSYAGWVRDILDTKPADINKNCRIDLTVLAEITANYPEEEG